MDEATGTVGAAEGTGWDLLLTEGLCCNNDKDDVILTSYDVIVTSTCTRTSACTLLYFLGSSLEDVLTP